MSVRMTAAQVNALHEILADNGAITNVELANTLAGVVVRTNRINLVGKVRGVMHHLIAGNGRVMDGRDFAHIFPFGDC